MGTSARFVELRVPLSGRDFCELVPGLKVLHGGEAKIHSITVDSREIVSGSLFVALKGERVDGHDFVRSMVATDIFGVLVDSWFAQKHGDLVEQLVASGKTVFVYDNALIALQIAAKNQLKNRGDKKVIGVTGSSGKTTVKEMIYSLLSQGTKVWASPGNMNSVIGIPLAIFSVPHDAEVLVMELAMSEAGEMAILSDIARPDIAVITNIGLAHIANLGSQDAIAFEKKQITAQFDGRQVLYVPKNDAYADFLTKAVHGKVVAYGFDGSNMGFSIDSYDGQKLLIDGNEFKLKYMGKHLRLDALCAYFVAKSVGLTTESIKQGFESLSLPALRGELVDGPIKLVLDCYNANPSSMAASISSHHERKYDGRKVYIVGDMLELGDVSKKCHEDIGRLLLELDADLALFFGDQMKQAFEYTQKEGIKQNFYHADTFENLENLANKLLKYGDLVLLKASRGMRLERIVETVDKIGKGEVVHV